MAGDPAEGELEGTGELIEKAFELIGLVLSIRPRPAELGGEPTQP